MLLLYAMLQTPMVPLGPPIESAQPLARMPSPEDLARDRDFDHDLPGPVLDFLGRRRICSGLEGNSGREAEDRRHFLSCATLPAEEARWRQLATGDTAVEAALSQDPRDYRIPRFVSRFDGEPPNVQVRRWTQEGIELTTGQPVSVIIETPASERPVIQITASWGDVPARTIHIPAADLPGLDLSTVSLWLRPAGEHAGLSITARFGRHRGYCWNGSADDRPEVNLFFTRTHVSASRQGWTECNPSHETFPVE